MKRDIDREKQFIEALEQYAFVMRDMQGDLAKLEAWCEGLSAALQVEPPPIKGLKQNSMLAGQAVAVHAQVRDCIERWTEARDIREPMRKLSESFGDRAVLLVFGKVNAGKSSFCNFIADRFAANGKTVQYFHLTGDAIVDTVERFVEGATETTSRIQGVRLGDKLVVLDTPGLHSVTAENGALTKRFTDSADAVLWLSSSTSPGQVQELDELSAELQSAKPLQPVITKSDTFEEDEVDDEIVKVLQNKSAQRRAGQEKDVHERATQKLVSAELDPTLLRMPVSVSAYAARQYAQASDALDAAGFLRLYGDLQIIVDDARRYKTRKAAQLTINHLDTNVLGPLQSTILPQLVALRRSADEAIRRLDARSQAIGVAVVASVVSELVTLLDRHKTSRDQKALDQDLSKLCTSTIAACIQGELRDYALQMNEALFQMNSSEQGTYEDFEVEVEVTSGRWRKAAASGAASIAGGVAGAFVGGPWGAALGTAIGGWLGEQGGEYLVSTERERRHAGTSFERLHSAIEQSLRERLPRIVAGFVNECKRSIEAVVQEAQRLENIVADGEQRLQALKKDILNESV